MNTVRCLQKLLAAGLLTTIGGCAALSDSVPPNGAKQSCAVNEVLVCKGRTATRLESGGNEAVEFCHCEPAN